MPIYEYRCTKCGHQFEVTHGVNETIEKCERCGAPVRKVFSPVGIIFKGSGFHINDYRKTPAPSDGEAKPAAAGTSTESKTDGKSGSDSDSTKGSAKAPAPSSAGSAPAKSS